MIAPQQKNGQLILSENVFHEISQILDEMAAKTRAEVIVFCESNGYPILHKGNIRGLDLPGIASLAANNFSATSQMASMLGEPSSFRYLYHEGDENNIYLSNVGFNFILLVIFKKDVALGIIRIYTKKAIDQLNDVLQAARQQEDKSKEVFDLEFKTLLTEELNRSLKL